MAVGFKWYQLNGMSYQMEVAPEIINARTFVPVRFIAEAFGANVGWDPATRTVTIKSDGKTIQLTVVRLLQLWTGKHTP